MVQTGHNDLVFDSRLLDFKAITSRPFVLSEGTLATGVVNTTYTSDIYTIFMSSPYRALFNWAAGVRFTTHLRLVVANSPQIQGAVALAHCPCGTSTAYPRLSATSTILQLPHVLVNFNQSNDGVLCVPWDSAFDYLPLDEARSLSTASKHLFGGAISLNIVMPVRGVDASVAAYTLYCSFHDIELIGEKPVLVTYAQSADVVQQERGPISGPLALGAQLMRTVSDAFSPHLPVVGKVLKVGSWATRFASKAFAAFGYSRPLVVDAPRRVMELTTGFTHLADQEDYAVNLSTLVDNRVVPDPKVADELDQMALEYVLTRPAPLSRVAFSSAAVVGTTLYQVYTSPMSMIWNGTSRGGVRALGSNTTLACVGTTPLSYVGQAFQYWRGSYVFSLTVAKTPFHSGKILVGWVPAGNLTPSYPSMYAPPNGPLPYLSKVWDLKAETTIEFEVPYIATTPYLGYATWSGNFFVRCLERLAFPSTVFNSVDILISVRAAPGFELAVPRDPVHYIPATATQANTIVAQSADVCEAREGFIPQPLPTPGQGERYESEVAHFCIGERVASLKQLAMRAGLFTRLLIGGSVLGLNGTYVIPELADASSYVYTFATGAAGGWFHALGIDNVAFLRSLYAYENGGMCYDVLANNLLSEGLLAVTQYSTITTLADGVSATNHTVRVPYNTSAPVLLEKGKMLHVRNPYYSPTRRQAITQGGTNFYNAMLENGVRPGPSVAVQAFTPFTLSEYAAVDVYRRAADDKSFFRWLGAPISMVGVNVSTVDGTWGELEGTNNRPYRWGAGATAPAAQIAPELEQQQQQAEPASQPEVADAEPFTDLS